MVTVEFKQRSKRRIKATSKKNCKRSKVLYVYTQEKRIRAQRITIECSCMPHGGQSDERQKEEVEEVR